MNILNLPNWEVQSVDEGAHDLRVHASFSVLPTVCIKCGSVGDLLRPALYKHGTVEQLLMDLPIHAKRVGILVTRLRYRCRDCGKTFLQPLPDMDERGNMTNRLVAHIHARALSHTFVEVAEEVGVDEKTVRNLFRQHVEELRQKIVPITPGILGIDELYLLGKPRCVITNIGERRVLDLLENRDKDTVYRYLLGLKDRQNVRCLTMDMWRPYRDAARAVWPNVPIVVDKFHVVRMASMSLEKVRKEIRGTLTDKLRRGMMHDRFILLKRGGKLDERETLLRDLWLSRYPTLAAAYALKEGVYDLWDEPISSSEAKAKYTEWRGGVTVELAPAFKDLTTALENWSEEAFAYFDNPNITNGYTESLNGLIKIANRQGRGYSFDAIRAKLIYDLGEHKVRRPRFGKDWQKDMIGESETTYFYFVGHGWTETPPVTVETLGVDFPRPQPIFLNACQDDFNSDDTSHEVTDSTPESE